MKETRYSVDTINAIMLNDMMITEQPTRVMVKRFS